MSNTPPHNESLFDRARRRAQEAGAQVAASGPVSNTGLEGAAVMGVGAVAGAVQPPPNTFTFRTSRPPQAALQLFVEALAALGDADTRAEVARQSAQQTTVTFIQLQKNGQWLPFVAVTLMYANEEVKATLSDKNLSALGSNLGDLGGTALKTLGRIASNPTNLGNVIGSLGEAARQTGTLISTANDMNLHSRIRDILSRLGEPLHEEWVRAKRLQREAEERADAASRCASCGTPWANAKLTTCPVCGSPRR